MKVMHYVLDEDLNPVAVRDALVWATWWEDNQPGADGDWICRVAETRIGALRISTVFLGLDHNFDDDGPPVLYETMLFGSVHGSPTWRHRTRAEAQAFHEQLVAEAHQWDLRSE